jgi:hypothetical protein
MQCDTFSCFTNTQFFTIKKKTKKIITSTRILIYLYLFYHTNTVLYQKLNAVPTVRYLVLVPGTYYQYLYARRDAWKYRRRDGWIDTVDGETDGRKEGKKDEKTEGQTDGCNLRSR